MTKKKIVNFSLRFLVVIVAFIPGWQCRSIDPIDEKFSEIELREDLIALRNKIRKNHPGLRYFNSTHSFSNYADSLVHSISDSMTVKDFYVFLNPLIEKTNCGHTSLSLPDYFQNYSKAENKNFPFRLYFQNQKAYCLKNFSNDLVIQPGTEILFINDVPISTIIENFLQQFSSDGFNQTYKYTKMNRMLYGLFPGYSKFPDSYEIEFISSTDSTINSIHIPAMSHQEIVENMGDNQSERKDSSPYKFSILDNLGTCVLTIKDFVSFPKSAYEEFLSNSFKEIQDRSLYNLILDVRGNDGGDPGNANFLLSYLMQGPYTYFKDEVLGYRSLKRILYPDKHAFTGNLYILIDGGCFSTTGHFLSILKDHQVGIMIGEETGGSSLCFGCPDEFTLPNSKIILNYTRCVYSTNVSKFNPGRGIFPDHEIIPDIDDMVNGKDTVLDFALALVSGGKTQ